MNPPKLQVFCPVDPSELESTPDGVFCRKCDQGLVDVSSPAGARNLKSGVCGVMRRCVAPVVGSTMVLSSCSVGRSPSSPDQPAEMKPAPDRQQIPVPGTYLHPGGKPLNPDAYPMAGPTDDPGIVISPYSRSRVDVSHVTEGTLVLDPAFKMADKKYFRVPADPRR